MKSKRKITRSASAREASQAAGRESVEKAAVMTAEKPAIDLNPSSLAASILSLQPAVVARKASKAAGRKPVKKAAAKPSKKPAVDSNPSPLVASTPSRQPAVVAHKASKGAGRKPVKKPVKKAAAKPRKKPAIGRNPSPLLTSTPSRQPAAVARKASKGSGRKPVEKPVKKAAAKPSKKPAIDVRPSVSASSSSSPKLAAVERKASKATGRKSAKKAAAKPSKKPAIDLKPSASATSSSSPKPAAVARKASKGSERKPAKKPVKKAAAKPNKKPSIGPNPSPLLASTPSLEPAAIPRSQIGPFEAPDKLRTGPGTVQRLPESAKVGARLGGMASLLCLAMASVVWVTSLQFADPRNMSDYGIVSILPVRFWIALVLNIAGFCVALNMKRLSAALAASHLVLLALILHGTPAFVYGTLRYSWAWKHIGVIDYIMRYGEPNRYTESLAAYQNWPGLFFVSAKIAQLLHASPLQVADAARFAPLVFELMFAMAIFWLLKLLTDNRRLSIASIAVFFVANWIGQDYFSPQAAAYFSYLVLLCLALGPLRLVRGPGTSLASRIRNAFVLPGELNSNYSSGAVFGAVLAFFALVIGMAATHQLTPFALLLALCLLWISGRISLWYPVFAGLALVAWLLYFAAPFFSDNIVSQIAQLGDGVSSVTRKMSRVSVTSEGRAFVVAAGRLLTLGMIALAGVGVIVRWFFGKRDYVAWILAIAPIALLVMSYGGEIHFRVYLFMLPMLALFATSPFFGRGTDDRSIIASAAFGVLLLAGAFAFLLANNGKDRYYYFTPEEVAAADWLYTNGEPGSLLIEGARNYPTQFKNYERFNYLAISEEVSGDRQDIVARPVETFFRWLGDTKWKGGYIIITRSQKIYADTEGNFDPGVLAEIEQKLLASPYFKVAYTNSDAKIFVLNR